MVIPIPAGRAHPTTTGTSTVGGNREYIVKGVGRKISRGRATKKDQK